MKKAGSRASRAREGAAERAIDGVPETWLSAEKIEAKISLVYFERFRWYCKKASTRARARELAERDARRVLEKRPEKVHGRFDACGIFRVNR